jgi:SAM-dependent methyltransferase
VLYKNRDNKFAGGCIATTLLHRGTDMSISCNVCCKEFGEPLYESLNDRSITTMNKPVAGKTRVYFCPGCGHLQTSKLPNLKEYYADEYAINITSEDDDQIYDVVDGKPVFRADHQAAVLLSKADLFPGCRVLDYGCAKAPTLKKILSIRPEIEAFLFDVTDKYVPFWNSFPKRPSWSVQLPDPAWFGTLDIVLSFYALEHVSDLHAALANVKSLLKPGGLFYFVVPNVYANAADFIVADHINHFSRNSLYALLKNEGFGYIEVDTVSHDAAFVVTARLQIGANIEEEAKSFEVTDTFSAAREMAHYWRDISRHVEEFETTIQATDVLAIYGAGFYGNLLACLLKNPENIACFVDQNPHLQGFDVRNKKVLLPDNLPQNVTHVLVGLNPRKAHAIIESIASWHRRALNYFYL